VRERETKYAGKSNRTKVAQRYLIAFTTIESKAKKERDLQMLWNFTPSSMTIGFDANIRYSVEKSSQPRLTILRKPLKKYNQY
jgi:hypothetical protein